MKKKMIDRIRRRVSSIIWLFIVIMFGCSWPGPHLQHNMNVETQFDGYQIYPGHQYFTSGTLEDPRAILALRQGYVLDSPKWRQVNMTSIELAQWVRALKKGFFVEYNTYSNGAKVVDANGDIAGYYYSVWEFPVVRMPDENSVRLAVPDAEYRSTNDHYREFTVGGDDGMVGH